PGVGLPDVRGLFELLQFDSCSLSNKRCCMGIGWSQFDSTGGAGCTKYSTANSLPAINGPPLAKCGCKRRRRNCTSKAVGQPTRSISAVNSNVVCGPIHDAYRS